MNHLPWYGGPFIIYSHMDVPCRCNAPNYTVRIYGPVKHTQYRRNKTNCH